MFELAPAPLPVPDATRRVFRRAWEDLSSPGAFWDADEGRAIAQLARARRAGLPADGAGLPVAATDAAGLLAATPAVTTREWVEQTTAELGEERYVELAGLVSTIVGIDTVTRLLGCDFEPFPTPVPGEPTGRRAAGALDKGRAWVTMRGVPVPPNVLSLVPSAQTAVNEVIEHLYMEYDEMDDPDVEKAGLHRTQIELVATTTSHGNECFY